MTALHIIDPAAPMSLPQALLVAVAGILTVLGELGVITLLILLLSKLIRSVTAKLQPPERSSGPETPAAAPLPATESCGDLTLVDVDEPTAAVIMAIVSHQSGIPLNRLRFRSIKKLEDPKV